VHLLGIFKILRFFFNVMSYLNCVPNQSTMFDVNVIETLKPIFQIGCNLRVELRNSQKKHHIFGGILALTLKQGNI
jgi:hypothetical protein